MTQYYMTSVINLVSSREEAERLIKKGDIGTIRGNEADGFTVTFLAIKPIQHGQGSYKFKMGEFPLKR